MKYPKARSSSSRGLLLFFAAFFLMLFVGCGGSFLDMRENYGVTIPIGEIKQQVYVSIGPDRFRVVEVEYTSNELIGLFDWEKPDDEDKKDLDELFDVLVSREKKDSSVHATEMLEKLQSKFSQFLCKKFSTRSPGIWCLLFYDEENNSLFVCQYNG